MSLELIRSSPLGVMCPVDFSGHRNWRMIHETNLEFESVPGGVRSPSSLSYFGKSENSNACIYVSGVARGVVVGAYGNEPVGFSGLRRVCFRKVFLVIPSF